MAPLWPTKQKINHRGHEHLILKKLSSIDAYRYFANDGVDFQCSRQTRSQFHDQHLLFVLIQLNCLDECRRNDVVNFVLFCKEVLIWQ